MAIPNIDDSYPVAPLENLFNLVGDAAETDIAAVQASVTSQGSTITTGFNLRQRYTYRPANAAARTALTGMRNGDTAYQLDTKIEYTYDGTTWQQSGGPYPMPYHARSDTANSNSLATSLTTITGWATSERDVGGITFAAGVFTVPVAGRYLLTLDATLNVGSITSGGVGYLINGTTTIGETNGAASTGGTTASSVETIYLAAGSTIAVQGKRNSAGSATTRRTTITYLGA